jgi:hypothetical protein
VDTCFKVHLARPPGREAVHRQFGGRGSCSPVEVNLAIISHQDRVPFLARIAPVFALPIRITSDLFPVEAAYGIARVIIVFHA